MVFAVLLFSLFAAVIGSIVRKSDAISLASIGSDATVVMRREEEVQGLRPRMHKKLVTDTSTSTFTSLLGGLGEPPSELAALLKDLDRKMQRLELPWGRGNCSFMDFNVPKDHVVPWTYHTGSFLKDSGGVAKWRNATRKLRLGLLSAIVSQPRHVKFIYWVDVNPKHPLLKIAMAPLKRWAHRFQVKAFKPKVEFAKAVPSLKHQLLALYNSDANKASRSDLLRVAVLHNYGGIWGDADVLLVHDMTPLAGLDWAYLGQKGFINNAMLSVSKPGSPFAASYMAAIAARGHVLSNQVYQFGPLLLRDLHFKIGHFHILPGCWFDGGWSGEKDAMSWNMFWKTALSPQKLAYLSPRCPGHLPFAYHWHGRWEEVMHEGSTASYMEKLYFDLLDIH